MMNEYGRSRDGWDWADAADAKSDDFTRLRRDPAAVALVRSMCRRSLRDTGHPAGRVPDIAMVCQDSDKGRHETGYAVILAVGDGQIDLLYKWAESAPAPWSSFGVKGEPSRNLDLNCQTCGRHYRMQYPEVLREAVGALAVTASGQHKGRARIVLR